MEHAGNGTQIAVGATEPGGGSADQGRHPRRPTGAVTVTAADEARDIAIEVAAIAMRNATDRGAVGLSMRARRDLAALAYDAIVRTVATDLRAEGDRLQKVHEKTGNLLGFSHALSFGDAATWLLSRKTTTTDRSQT